MIFFCAFLALFSNVKGFGPPSLETNGPRIIGGEIARLGEYPNIVSLQFLSNVEQYFSHHLCGGTLLDASHVLTAAHCLTGWEENLDLLRVVLNTNNTISKLYSPDTIEYHKCQSFKIHPKYDGRTNSPFDVALILLERPVQNGTFVTIATSANDASPGSIAHAAGWGDVDSLELDRHPTPADEFSCSACNISCKSDQKCQYGFTGCDDTRCTFLSTKASTCASCSISCEDGLCDFYMVNVVVSYLKRCPTAEEAKLYTLCKRNAYDGMESIRVTPYNLRKVKIEIIADDKCGYYDDNYYDADDITPEYHICAGAQEGGKDSCQGDSGGPLYVKGKQVGIVSYGYDCAIKGYPGIYVDVAAHSQWIISNSNYPTLAPTTQPSNAPTKSKAGNDGLIAGVATGGFAIFVVLFAVALRVLRSNRKELNSSDDNSVVVNPNTDF